MGGVDKGDQLRAHGGGFAKKAHYKKWYKKAYFAVLDCMLMNSYIAWNESVKERGVHNRLPLSRDKFYTHVAESLLNFREKDSTVPPNGSSVSGRSVASQRSGDSRHSGVSNRECESTTKAHLAVSNKSRSRCMVCRLELSMDKTFSQKGLARGVADCSEQDCPIHAHNTLVPEAGRQIHNFPEFQGMTCFQIAHSHEARGLWNLYPEGKQTVNPVKSHHIYQQLRILHRLDPVVRRKKARTTTTDNDNDTTTS